MKILIIGLWLAYIIAEIFIHDYIITVRKKRPFYLHFFLQRGIAAILHGVLYLWLFFESYGYETSIKNYIPLFLFQITSFWILFDLGLNLKRGKKWYYKGKTSGWLDRLLPTKLYWGLKILAICILIFSII